jgi:hypothetical protein
MMRKILFAVFTIMNCYTPAAAQESTLLSLDFDGANYTVSSVNSNTGAKTALKSFTSPYGTCAGCSFIDEYGGKFYIGGANGFAIYDISNNSVSYLAKDGGTLLYRQMAWSGDDVISATSDEAEIKIDEANNTVNIDNAAISDGDGKNIIAVKNDGAVHIGENSLVTVERNGRQYLYGTDASGSMIDLDIMAGSDFRIHGISVLDSLRGLGDGVEGSAALTAALSSVPSSAPDYEYYCGGGLGAYGSSQAAALGCAKDHSETLSFHAGASYLLGGGEAYGVDEFSDFAFKAGFTYKFGKKSQSNPVETASINAAALSASSKVEQTKLKAQVNDLRHKLAMMEEKLEVITASLDTGPNTDKVAMAR